jgi:hypothetical protein
MTKYSFDSSKHVAGPFETEAEAYVAMQDSAQKEYNIDVNENEWETELYVDSEAGEITITNYFDTGNDVTEFFTFEIE